MKQLSSAEVRQLFLDFFKEKGHTIEPSACLLYTSDAADELDGVDLGGCRNIKKKKKKNKYMHLLCENHKHNLYPYLYTVILALRS
ncbi:hypothetical protein LKL54_15585, partial [Listeria monocytogenes ATCC 19115]